MESCDKNRARHSGTNASFRFSCAKDPGQLHNEPVNASNHTITLLKPK